MSKKSTISLEDIQDKYSDAERAEMYDSLIMRLQLALMAGRDTLEDEVKHELNGLRGALPHPEDIIEDAVQHREFHWLETLHRVLEKAMKFIFNEQYYDRRYREEQLRLQQYSLDVSSRITKPPIPDYYPTEVPGSFMGVETPRKSSGDVPPLKNPFDNYRF